MIEHRIPEIAGCMPLERYVRRAWPMLPSRVVRDLLKKRDVRVNGVKSGAAQQVRGGDLLAVYLEDKWFDSDPQVLWTDERLIVCTKPQGLPVDVDQDGVGADTLLARIRQRWPEAQLCHRLDAPTGGVVLAAVDEGVWRQALDAFRDHDRGVRKEYCALAFGRFERPEGVLRAWLVKDARQSMVRILDKKTVGAKPVETRYRVDDLCRPGLYRVMLEPVTGRTHQLRAHMASFGHPLLGDDRYGDRSANRQYPGVGLCLWHERLTIPEKSPLADYRGRQFVAPAPDWLKDN